MWGTSRVIVSAGFRVAVRRAPGGAPQARFRFRSQQKYPASQLFLLMTLGPMIALLPLAERARGYLMALGLENMDGPDAAV